MITASLIHAAANQVDSSAGVDQLGGPVTRPALAREIQLPIKSVQEKQQPKERLLKRLVKLAKGPAGLHELSSYASYEKVAKGVRKLASLDEPGRGQKDRANATATSPHASPLGRRVSLDSDSLLQDHVLQQTAAIKNLQVISCRLSLTRSLYQHTY
jgi:hypothetical protein